MCRKWKENGTIKYVGVEDKLTNNKTKTKEKIQDSALYSWLSINNDPC